MTLRPDISVIIATYEASEFVHIALDSCLAQTGVELEVIVVDDGSKVSSEQVVTRYARDDRRFKFIGLSENAGPSAARNAGLAAATGDFIAVLDSDDAFLPGRLEHLLKLAQRTQSDIVADNMYTVASLNTGDVDRQPFLTPAALNSEQPIELAAYIDPHSSDVFGNPLGYLKPLFSRAFLSKHDLTYDTSLTNSEDYYLVATALALGAKMTVSAQPGYLYLVRPGSISYRLNPAQTAAILSAEANFMAQFGASVTRDTKTALERRLRMLQHVHEYETLRDSLKTRALGAFFKHLLARPQSAPHHLYQIGKVGLQRLGL